MSRLIAWFVSAMVVLGIGTSVAIFGFGYFEPGWGRVYALKLALLVGVGLAAVGGATYAAASIARRSHPTLQQASIAGVVFQAGLFGVVEGIKHVVPSMNSVFVAAVVAALLGAASSFLAFRHAA